MLQVSLFLLPPSTNFIVMAPRVHPCPIAQELPGNVGWTLQITEKRKQRHPQKNRKSHQKKMEEKDRNLQWQLCFHVWLHSPTYPKQGSCGYDWRCDCLALFCRAHTKGPALLPGAWTQAPQHPTGLPGVLGRLLGIRGQAGDMESCWMARPGCKEASCLFGKGHYCCSQTFCSECLPQ